MPFKLKILSKEDPGIVIVSRTNLSEFSTPAVFALCGTQKRLVEEEGRLHIGSGFQCLEIQFVDGQGRTALVFLEEDANNLVIRGNIAGGMQSLRSLEEKSFLPQKKTLSLHLRKDGFLVIGALSKNFKWVSQGKEWREAWIEVPVFRPKEKEDTASSASEKEKGVTTSSPSS